MAETTQPDFDKLVQHTVRIELKDGSTLIYPVSRESKTALYDLLRNDIISMTDLSFIWFHIPKDRLVLVNRKDIIRITFCFDALDGKGPQYKDNFNVVIEPDEAGLAEGDMDNDPPQLIVKHNRQLENTEFIKGITMQTEGYFGNVSTYVSLGEGDVQGFDFEYMEDEEEWMLLTYKYLQFIDDDGEENFMPLENISVIEVERLLLMNDETLDLYLNRD